MKHINIFDTLKSYTQARIGLQRAGHAVGTRENLEFQWAHAQARDAIHTPWDFSDLKFGHYQTKLLNTQVQTRSEYLTRPDLGRVLNDESCQWLKNKSEKNLDLVLIISNGLSSLAIHKHASQYLNFLLSELEKKSYAFGKIFLIPNARVAIGDQIGGILKPKLTLIVIGERPGLSSPDSMGVYLSYDPKPGKTDADRNCISNIREPHGLSYELAVIKTLFLIEESLRRRLSGFELKDGTERTNSRISK